MNRFLRKVIMNGIVVVPLLMWFSEATLIGSLVAAVVLSFVAYYLGDQLILRASNNTVATLADAGLSLFYLYWTAYMFDWELTLWEAVVITGAIAVVEWIFHRQLERYDTRG